MVHELGVLGQFRPKKLHIKSGWHLHVFIGYIKLFNNKKISKTCKCHQFYMCNFIYVYPQFIYSENHKQKIINIYNNFFNHTTLSWNPDFACYSNYLIFNRVNFVTLPTNLFIFDLAYIIICINLNLLSNLSYRNLLSISMHLIKLFLRTFVDEIYRNL